jgi:hypothetical protein
MSWYRRNSFVDPGN